MLHYSLRLLNLDLEYELLECKKGEFKGLVRYLVLTALLERELE